MTARQQDPGSRRWLLSAAVALVLVAAMVMVAGCVSGTQPVDNRTETTPSTTPTIVLSDKELAEQTIAGAKEQIENADSVIAWFKGNASTNDDSRLPLIITKREIAVSYIVTAEDEIANGNK
jgi:hypothetical protein